MNQLASVRAQCPYCGERIELMIDDSAEHQQYVEDCSVCCRPMVVTVVVDADSVAVSVQRDD